MPTPPAASTAESTDLVDMLQNTAFAWVVLGISLVLTLVGWYVSGYYVERRANERFVFEVDEAQRAIVKRMQEYEQMLRGGVGLFRVNENVGRAAWGAYVATLQIEKYWPGIQGVGFSRWLSSGEVPAFTARVRAEGFPEFRIHPEGRRDVYTSIVFLEPFSGRNLRAFGFDMYSEPVRRAAMDRARDHGDAAVSGRVTLVQETEKDVQAGFLMYLPVYQSGVPQFTLEERRAALLGFVYSPFRVNDLMRGILDERDPALDFRIWDGTDTNDASLLYDNHPATAVVPRTAKYVSAVTIQLPGRVWTARFQSTAAFETEMTSSQPQLIAIGGVLVDLLLFVVIVSISRNRALLHERAEVAQQRYVDSERRFQGIVESAPLALMLVDVDGQIRQVNAFVSQMFGYTPEEMIGRPVEMLMPERFRSGHGAQRAGFVRAPSTRAMGQGRELFALRKDGGEFPVEIGLGAVNTVDGVSILASVIDITERRNVEDRVRRERLYLRGVIDSLDDGVVIAEENGQLVLFNEALRAMHGVGAQPVPMEQWARHYSLYRSDGTTPLAAADMPLVRALRGETVREQEVVIAPPDLPRRRVRVNAQAVTLANGVKVGAVAVIHDLGLYTEPAKPKIGPVAATTEKSVFSFESKAHNAAPTLDAAMTRQLASLLGPRALPFIDALLEGVPRQLQAMEEALTAKDDAAIRREAHTIRGNCGNIGAATLGEICVSISAACKENRWADVAALIADLRREYSERVQPAIVAFRASLAPKSVTN